MGKENKIAVGIRLFVGRDLPMGDKPNEFERFVSCSISGIDLGLGIDNILECKFYDDLTGYIYFHFENPVSRETLELFFEEEEIIDKLTNTKNDDTVKDKKPKQKTKQFRVSTSG